ncbi:MAG: YggS family pyridoxal phosphate-dependent enzyme [Deltaproteobacteria bacterium]|nr:YggS family pyridoxal phosphate-dependent enzyme [Deltaproteobacteria bacterium]
MADQIAENIRVIRERMAGAARRSGRDPDSVRLLAVSKKKPAGMIAQALAAGQTLFGENYVQEALEKIEMFSTGSLAANGPAPRWHMIGHLQTNKARFIPGRFQAVETVDSERLARALSRHAESTGATLEVLLQVNWTAEAGKAGLTGRDDVKRLMEGVLEMPALELKGLMTIPDPELDEVGTRKVYAAIRALREELAGSLGLKDSFTELSYGMSHDFELAIEEGSTLVRVGTAIFGER